MLEEPSPAGELAPYPELSIQGCACVVCRLCSGVRVPQTTRERAVSPVTCSALAMSTDVTVRRGGLPLCT